MGLARKIGNDIALRLHAAGRVASPWIHNTDADVRPAERLLRPDGEDPARRATPRRSTSSSTGSTTTRRSPRPRASTRSRSATTRSGSRGPAPPTPTRPWEAASPSAPRPTRRCAAFPKKNAAEDFYVLDKLAKVGSIVRLAGRPLLLEGRVSDRVPFGTGKALSDLVTKKRALSGFRLYHPAVFAHLAAWLRVLEASAESGGRVDVALEELPRENPFFLTGLLVESLEKMGAFPAMREAIARSSGDPSTMLRHFHTWFDAFRTLKLVHALRDGGLPLPRLPAGARRGAVHGALGIDRGGLGSPPTRARGRRAQAGGDSGGTRNGRPDAA